MNNECIKTVRLIPYRRPYGPSFRLELFDGNASDSAGRFAVDYRLIQCRYRDSMGIMHKRQVIFDSVNGSESSICMRECIDSRRAAMLVLSWLTLRPGDTDREYFDGYSEQQMEFAQQHAESLSIYCYDL